MAGILLISALASLGVFTALLLTGTPLLGALAAYPAVGAAIIVFCATWIMLFAPAAPHGPHGPGPQTA